MFVDLLKVESSNMISEKSTSSMKDFSYFIIGMSDNIGQWTYRESYILEVKK